MKKKEYKINPIKMNTLTYEDAIAGGLTSSFLRTVARSLERLSKDCFKRLHDENFANRFDNGLDETKASLTEAGKVNSENAFAIRSLATRLKKEGK